MTNQQDSGGIVVMEAALAHVPAIGEVVRAAFGGDAESRLVEALRAEGAVVAELVALEKGRVIGHVMFSALGCAPADRKVAALAPVAVLPERQGTGIGRMAVRQGLDLCRKRGIDAITVLGDPAYYRSFGFAHRTADDFECVYSGPAFMALELRNGALDGVKRKLTYPRAFENV